MSSFGLAVYRLIFSVSLFERSAVASQRPGHARTEHVIGFGRDSARHNPHRKEKRFRLWITDYAQEIKRQTSKQSYQLRAIYNHSHRACADQIVSPCDFYMHTLHPKIKRICQHKIVKCKKRAECTFRFYVFVLGLSLFITSLNSQRSHDLYLHRI